MTDKLSLFDFIVFVLPGSIVVSGLKMLTNVAMALLITTMLTIACICMDSKINLICGVLKYILPQLVMAALTCWLARRRQKRMISSVYWGYGKI
jgi:hypothetical protein